MANKIIYIDMDDVICNYSSAYEHMLAENPLEKYPQCQSGFFENLVPVEKAIESVNYLRNSKIFDVYILTVPSTYYPLCYTEKRLWVENHFGFEMVERLIISSNKGLNKGDYLIDDHIEGRGQENFEGKLLQFGGSDYLDWNGVVAYFKTEYLYLYNSLL